MSLRNGLLRNSLRNILNTNRASHLCSVLFLYGSGSQPLSVTGPLNSFSIRRGPGGWKTLLYANLAQCINMQGPAWPDTCYKFRRRSYGYIVFRCGRRLPTPWSDILPRIFCPEDEESRSSLTTVPTCQTVRCNQCSPTWKPWIS
jgi:hypothetical protein